MDEQVRILHIVNSMNRGGIETLLMSLYRNVDRKRIQFDFLSHTKDSCFTKEIESLGGRVYCIPRFSFWRFDKQYQEYVNFFAEHSEYQIVHSHINLSSLGVLRAAYKAGVPVRICHLHNTNRKEKHIPLSYRCKKLVFPLTSRFLTHRFACSKLVAMHGYGKKSEEAVIIKNGVETEKFQFCLANRIRKRKELDWKDKRVFLDVASLTTQKNHSFLIEVFNEILKLEKNAILALAGTGSLRTQIETQVKRLGIEENVQFLGARNDVPDLLRAADLFLLPSLYEGFGIALLEAQTAGIFSVASDSIPREVDVADLIRFVSLEESANRWAQIALEEVNRKRKSRETYAEIVKNAGYDICTSVKELTEFYLNEYQKNLNV